MPEFILNAGLPRTGTTSFAAACRLAGLSTLHSWEPRKPVGGEDGRNQWWRAEYEKVLLGAPGELSRYDSLSDNPFMFQSARFLRAYPGSRLVCTTRSAATWVESILHCKPNNCAGGLYLLRQYTHLNLTYPYRNDSATRTALFALFELHYRTECATATMLDLGMSSAELYSRLCAAMPPRHHEHCIRATTGIAWPINTAHAKHRVRQQLANAAPPQPPAAPPSCSFQMPNKTEYLPPHEEAFGHDCPAWSHDSGVSAPLDQCAVAINLPAQGFGSYLHRLVLATLQSSKRGRRFIPMLHPRVRDYGVLTREMGITPRHPRQHACKHRQYRCLFEIPPLEECRNTTNLGVLDRDRTALGVEIFFREASATLSSLMRPTPELAALLMVSPGPTSIPTSTSASTSASTAASTGTFTPASTPTPAFPTWPPMNSTPPDIEALVAPRAFFPVRPCVTVQLRFGDACIKEAVKRKCSPLQEFVNASVHLANHYGIKQLVVASDSARERAAFIQMLPAWLHASTPPTAPDQLVGDALLALETTVERLWRDNVTSGAQSLKAYLTDVYAMAACDAFVGKLTSNVARLVLELMSARRGRVVPFISLDVKWCLGGRENNPLGQGYNVSYFPCM